MRPRVKGAGRPHHLTRSIEIDADRERVFARWTGYEDLPRLMESVRRVKCIDARRLLWDVDVAGRQVVWEARIVELNPGRLVRWTSSWGAPHAGEVRFAAIPGGGTRIGVEIEYRPRGLLERMGARLGLVDAHVGRDLACFKRFLEGLRRDEKLAHAS